MFVFSVCCLVSRRCHTISILYPLAPESHIIGLSAFSRPDLRAIFSINCFSRLYLAHSKVAPGWVEHTKKGNSLSRKIDHKVRQCFLDSRQISYQLKSCILSQSSRLLRKNSRLLLGTCQFLFLGFQCEDSLPIQELCQTEDIWLKSASEGKRAVY